MYSTKNLKDFLDLGGSNRSSLVLKSRLVINGLGNVEINLLVEYIKLLKHSTILNKMSYDFYINRLTYTQLQRKYKKTKGQIGNTIKRGSDKVFREIGCDLYLEITNKRLTPERYSDYMKLLLSLQKQYAKEKNVLTEQLVVDITDYLPSPIENNPNISEQLFIEAVTKLKILSLPNLEMILKVIPSDILGYIRYLLEEDDDLLIDIDKQYKKILIERLMLKQE